LHLRYFVAHKHTHLVKLEVIIYFHK
jgi:hypothetical protein